MISSIGRHCGIQLDILADRCRELFRVKLDNAFDGAGTILKRRFFIGGQSAGYGGHCRGTAHNGGRGVDLRLSRQLARILKSARYTCNLRFKENITIAGGAGNGGIAREISIEIRAFDPCRRSSRK